MTSVSIDDRAGLPAQALRELRAAIETQATLQSAVRWAFQRGYDLVDVFDQDEYTRDVVFRVEPTVFLVYDAT